MASLWSHSSLMTRLGMGRGAWCVGRDGTREFVGEALEQQAAEFGGAHAQAVGEGPESVIFGGCQGDNEVSGALFEGFRGFDGLRLGLENPGVGLWVTVDDSAGEFIEGHGRRAIRGPWCAVRADG